MQVVTTATCCYHINIQCTGSNRSFEVDLTGSTLTFQVGRRACGGAEPPEGAAHTARWAQSGDLGMISITSCQGLYLHGPTTADFAASQIPITQVQVSAAAAQVGPGALLSLHGMHRGPSLASSVCQTAAPSSRFSLTCAHAVLLAAALTASSNGTACGRWATPLSICWM